MEITSNKDACQLYNKLLALGCCNLCCLRFLGETEPESYRNLAETYEKRGLPYEAEGNAAAKLSKSSPCAACLGLLQRSVCNETLEKIADAIRLGDYDSRSFRIGLTLPVSYQLRAHALWLHLALVCPAYTSTVFALGCVTVSVKDVWKYVFAPQLAAMVDKSYESGSALLVAVTIEYQDDDKECACLSAMHPDIYKRPRGGVKRRMQLAKELYSRKSVEATLQQLTPDSLFTAHAPTPPHQPTAFVSCIDITLSHSPIYVAGRYNKWSRTLSQTPWVIEGERRLENSVEEIITIPLLNTTRSSGGGKLIASGREDVDVRMLGRGRPFAVEVPDPHTVNLSSSVMADLQRRINEGPHASLVTVRDLQLVSKRSLAELKKGEERKTKIYCAYCVVWGAWPEGALKGLVGKAPLTLEQRTPIRVLHRRPMAMRHKVVYSMDAVPFGSQGSGVDRASFFKLVLRTQAGTYIKEFVHGDLGRTKPSLRDLLGNPTIDILALDVQDIELDWPPFIANEL